MHFFFHFLAAFCRDPFDVSIIGEEQKRWSFVECTFPPGQMNPYSRSYTQRAVCKKTVTFGEHISFIEEIDLINVVFGFK